MRTMLWDTKVFKLKMIDTSYLSAKQSRAGILAAGLVDKSKQPSRQPASPGRPAATRAVTPSDQECKICM